MRLAARAPQPLVRYGRDGEVSVEQVRDAARRLCDNVERVLVGKRDAIELAVVALLCEGHVLIEDVPGTGKTTLARVLAQSLGGTFRRVQCTPDLLPSDVTGVAIFDQRASAFEFRPGPIFANVLMADEINRATPRTQSAVLEAMQERQVSVDGVTHPLPRPFTVIATQNPVELEGTFPLPEAQLDRFLLRLSLGYPDARDERLMLHRMRDLANASADGLPGSRSDPGASSPAQVTAPSTQHTIPAVLGPADALALHAACRQVHVEGAVEEYVVAVARATREEADVRLGASPRATLDLYHAAQAWAAMQGREFVTPDDVKRLAAPVLAHRLVLGVDARLRGRAAAEVIATLVDTVPVPVE
jgi:MoxR-like ATPase